MRRARRRLLRGLRRVYSRVRAWIRLSLSRLGPYRPMAGGRDVLDSEYLAGEWDYLAGDLELPRFGVVAAYCLRDSGGPRILEIGCGEGLLPQRIGTTRFSRYVGVDVSRAAIERATSKQLAGAEFVADDAFAFDPGAEFDVIVFNEVLEYAPRPVELVRRYERWLADDGWFVVSQYKATDDARTRKIWKALHRMYSPALRTEVTTASELSWIIELLPKPGDSARR